MHTQLTTTHNSTGITEEEDGIVDAIEKKGEDFPMTVHYAKCIV